MKDTRELDQLPAHWIRMWAVTADGKGAMCIGAAPTASATRAVLLALASVCSAGGLAVWHTATEGNNPADRLLFLVVPIGNRVKVTDFFREWATRYGFDDPGDKSGLYDPKSLFMLPQHN